MNVVVRVRGRVIMKFQQRPEDAGGFIHADIRRKCSSGVENSQHKSPEAGVLQQLEEEEIIISWAGVSKERGCR